MAKKRGDRLEELKSSAEKVWLAGLGALAQAGKQGDKLFKALVKKGKKYEELIPTASDSVKENVRLAKKQANEAFREMEDAFDRQVRKAMDRAGLATKADVDALKKEMARLNKDAKTGRASSQKRTKAAGTKTARKKKAASGKRSKKA